MPDHGTESARRHSEESPASTGGGGPAPGKRTRSEALPPQPREPRHYDMTDVPLVDLGLYCDRPEAAGDDGCFLEPQPQDNLLKTIAVDASTVGTSVQAAISDVKDEIRGEHIQWGITEEVLYMAVSLLIGGAFGAAFAGTALAARVEKATAFIGKGVRAEVMHGGKAPASDDEFLTYTRDVESAIAQRLVQSVAELGLDHNEMLALHHALTDPAVVGQAVLQRHLRQQLALFRKNRIEVVGALSLGREVAAPVIVQYRRHSYIVLCKAFGLAHSGLALTGANTGNDEEPLTMQSLEFERIVEPTMHSIMLTAWQARRPGEPVPTLNLNDPRDRDKVRWEGTFKLELDHHPDPTGVMYEHGDIDAADPHEAAPVVAAQ